MSKPPRDFNHYLAEFRARVFAPRRIELPGEPGVHVRVRLLSEHEIDLCRHSAVEYVKQQRFDTVVDADTTLEREVRRAIVWRAFLTERDADGEEVRFFGSPAKLRDNVDRVTLDRLFDAYLDHQAEVADAGTLSDDTADGAIDLGRRNPVAFAALLSGLDGVGLRRLAQRMMSALNEREKGPAA